MLFLEQSDFLMIDRVFFLHSELYSHIFFFKFFHHGGILEAVIQSFY